MPFDGEKDAVPDRVAAIMLLAADLIRVRGLAQGTREDRETGAVCLHGALSIAENDSAYSEGPLHAAASHRFYRYLTLRGDDAGIAPPRQGHCRFIGCAAWNNKDGRTAEEVIAALENAAAFVSV